MPDDEDKKIDSPTASPSAPRAKSPTPLYFSTGQGKGRQRAFTDDLGASLKSGEPLSNRGHVGQSWVLTLDGKKKVFKADKPAVCVLEASAHIEAVESIAEQSTFNCARLNTEEDRSPDHINFVTVQDYVTAAAGCRLEKLDVILLNEERPARRPVSAEKLHENDIQERLSNNFSQDGLNSLAQAIFLSQLNGDESLHTAQFMAHVNKKTDKVDAITRIDLGARCRHAYSRLTNMAVATDKEHDSNYSFDILCTSKQYTSSGQLGNDYISFLVQNETVRNKLIELWLEFKGNKEVQKNFFKEEGARVIEVLMAVPPALQAQAIAGILYEISKGAKKEKANLLKDIFPNTTEENKVLRDACAKGISKGKLDAAERIIEIPEQDYKMLVERVADKMRLLCQVRAEYYCLSAARYDAKTASPKKTSGKKPSP